MLKLGTSINSAFKMALETWASWVKEKVDLKRTHVFFRTYEPSHWRCVFSHTSDLFQCIVLLVLCYKGT